MQAAIRSQPARARQAPVLCGERVLRSGRSCTAARGGDRGLLQLRCVRARTYLEKFFHLRITLPQPDSPTQDKTSRYLDYLCQVMELRSRQPHYDESVRNGLANLSRVYGLPLRTLERVVTNAALVYAATSERHFREASLVVGLCVMKQIKPDLFAKARSGAIRWPEARDFLHLDEWNGRSTREYYEVWWRYVTEKELPNEDWVYAVKSDLVRYNLDREMILPIICGFMDKLHIIDHDDLTTRGA